MRSDVMDIQELGRYLKLAPVTLYKMVREGRIPHRRIGKSLRFPKQMVDDWLAQPQPTNPSKHSIDELGLPPNVYKAVASFSKIIKELLKNRIEGIRLYGSFARGEGRIDSDIDIAVIVDRKDLNITRKVSRVAGDVSLEFDTFVSVTILEAETHKKGIKEGYPFHLKIEEEGVSL